MQAVQPEDLTEVFADAGAGITALASTLHDIARQFRRDQVSDANANMADATRTLRQFVMFLGIVHSRGGVWVQQLHVDGTTLDEQIQQIATWLGALVEAQGDRDWLSVADTLEFDLAPFLVRCGANLTERGQAR